MANEPERPIEKLLRAAAKKRRDAAGAPFELHPADRRLLQAEVARQFAGPRREAGSLGAIVARLWPRFAWAVGILAVLGVSVWVLMPPPRGGESEMRLAKNRAGFEAAPAAAPVPAWSPSVAGEYLAADLQQSPKDKAWPAEPKPAAEALGHLADSNLRAPAGRDLDRDKLALAASPPPADWQDAARNQPATPGGASAQGSFGKAGGGTEKRYGLASTPDTPASVPAVPATAPTVAMAPEAASAAAREGLATPVLDESGQPARNQEFMATFAAAERPQSAWAITNGLSAAAANALTGVKGVGVLQRFVQAAPGPGTKADAKDQVTTAQPVLASFQVEQAGEKLRIVDGDGSVYTGNLWLADAGRRARGEKAAAPAPLRADRAPSGGFKATASPGYDSGQLEPRSYSFRVAGTNRSLNQTVVFTGDLLAGTDSTLATSAGTNLILEASRSPYQSAPAQPVLLPLVKTRITGKAVVGGGKAIEIDALPAQP